MKFKKIVLVNKFTFAKCAIFIHHDDNGWNLKGSSNILGPSNQSRPVSIKDNSSIDSKNSPNELNNVGNNYTVLLPI